MSPNINKKITQKLDPNTFLKKLSGEQRNYITSFINSNRNDLRKTVYISSGGKYYKYVDFILAFVYKMGYVPVHPILNLNYYISTIAHDYDKGEIVKDCFSLIDGCDELWVIDEATPNFGDEKHILGSKPITSFPEGVLMEIYYWLTTRPNQPIRFFTWQDIGAPKYMLHDKWTLIKSGKGNNQEVESAPGRFAIIDLGSSTVKLTLCEIKPDKSLDTLYKKSITVNLAENFFNNLELQEAPMQRTIQAVLDFQQSAMDYGITDIVVVGTGVLRKAKNIDRFRLLVKKETDLDVRIISGKDEALMIYRAIEDSFEDIDKGLIMVNAGGGSTEVVIGSAGQVVQYSIPLGISELNEKYIKSYPISKLDYANIKKFVKGVIAKHIKKPVSSKEHYLVYSGGELDYMIITGFPLDDFTKSMSHPKMINIQKLKLHTEKMRSMSLEKLQSYMPTNPAWMNGAIASNTILETFAEFFGSELIIPSNKNLNDGVLLEMVK